MAITFTSLIPRIKFDKHFHNWSALGFFLQDIWRPDSFFKNAKDVTFQEMTIPNHYIWLYKDKTILYMVK